MNKRLRVPLILLVILLALGGLARWDEWKSSKETAAEKAKGKLTDIKPDDVTAVDYASTVSDAPPASDDGASKSEPAKSGSVIASIAKVGDAWRLSKPIEAPADAATIADLVKAITDYTYASVVTDTKDKWGDFGLVNPQRTVTLTYNLDGKAQAFTIYIGNKAPVGYSVYVRTSTGGDKVFMGGQHLLLSTAKSLTDFRDKSVVKIDEKTIKNFVYADKTHPAITLERSADGRYAITKPEALEADDNEVRDFLAGLNQLRAESFVDAPRSNETLSFNDPDYTITWTNDKGEATSLKILDRGNKIGASLDARQRLFLLADDQRAKIKKELIHFRNRRVLRMDSLDLARVEVDGDKYVNVAGSWFKPEDAAKLDEKGALKAGEKDKPAEAPHVRAFVVDLEFARADQFLAATDPAVKALTAPPEHRITLSFKDPNKNPDMVIDTFPVPGQTEKLYMRRSGSQQVYRINKSVLNSMKPGKTEPLTASPAADAAFEEAPPADEDLSPDEPAPDLSKAEEVKANKG